MILLKGMPLRKEDESQIISLNLSEKQINFLLYVSAKNLDALAYVHQIEKFLTKVGLHYQEINIDDGYDESTFKLIEEKNSSIILARPLPKEFMSLALKHLKYENDPDCLGLESAGHIFFNDGLYPATAMSVLRLLDYYSIDVTGMKTLVIGRSLNVGMPLSYGLLKKNAFVSIAHSKVSTKDLINQCQNSDLVVLASGQKGLIPPIGFNKDQILIDCGYHADDGKGDLGFEVNDDSFKAYTPVPGGVGPLTISTLIINALKKKGFIQ